MANFIFRRILYIVLVLFMISFIIFMLFRTMPGDPIEMFLPLELQITMQPEQLAAARAEIIETMGLDQPHVIQYFFWLRAVFQGNFGTSMETRSPVIDHVRAPMANTIVMSIMNMTIVFAITIPVGVVSAIKRGKLFDNTALVTSMIGMSVPGFLFGLIMIVVFSIWLDIFPMFGMASMMPPPTGTLAWYLDRLRYMALPLFSLALMSMAGMIRYIRSSMIEALNMDCVRTARAKGLAEKTVIYSHAFRNALIPIVTVMAGWFIGIFSGSLAIELTFQWQGMGQIMINALNLRDIPVLMTMNVFYALIAYVGILVLDILYVFIDPRIRYT
ncbi:MAG: ABC transporter permease [Defluviitaleaceae bacterium]|nr:ABC transporter permease [Defluviitaleaceae bacterium]MCL2273580.1 ABC transporter permease [Defluviitaleaceae bacterium]